MPNDPEHMRKIIIFDMYDDRVGKPGWYTFSFGIPVTGNAEIDRPVFRCFEWRPPLSSLVG
jgi:hypothetical protein